MGVVNIQNFTGGCCKYTELFTIPIYFVQEYIYYETAGQVVYVFLHKINENTVLLRVSNVILKVSNFFYSMRIIYFIERIKLYLTKPNN